MALRQTRAGWDSRDRFLSCTGRHVSYEQTGVTLERCVTLADESGRCNRNDRERIEGIRLARKTFRIEDLGASAAVLCPFLDCDTEEGAIEISINGHALTYQRPKERPYWEDRWTRIEVPVDWLETGDNEVVFRALEGSTWYLLIEQSRYPDRSSVSEDGGSTWRSEELGENGRADGEYMVRLRLDQYAPQGELCSEPVDLLLADSDAGVAARGTVAELDIGIDAELRPEDAATVQWRGGPVPAYDPERWTAWEDVAGAVRPGNDVRFVQWRVLLSTSDPAGSPEVSAVELVAKVEALSAATVKVLSANNPELRRSSFRFGYLPEDSARGRRLRERWKLDEVIRGAKSEFDAFLHLRNWVREQWEDGWNMGEADFCPPWDAMVILELASRKLSLGMCTHYATVMSHCCAALGLVARTQIMRSHCISEVWSPQHGKWVAMDVGGDADDETKFTYHLERNGVPLSALEAHRAWVDEDYDDVEVVPKPPAATGDRFEVAKRLQLFERFMISLRNDELVTMGPGEPEHGKISYHFDDYLFWEDEKTEPLPWFSRHTSRPDDLYWSVNQVRIHLQRSAQPDLLSVALESETPNLACFEQRFDDGEWEECGPAFEWRLPGGATRLQVRPVNRFGRRGTTSEITVEPVA